MDEAQARKIAEEADPDAEYDQPAGDHVREAKDLLGDEAPWYQIAAVGNAIAAEERTEEEE